jgi:hypothetical protein
MRSKYEVEMKTAQSRAEHRAEQKLEVELATFATQNELVSESIWALH